MTVQPLPHIAALAAYGYVPVDIAPGKKLVPLALNESAFPPSPTVPRAIADAAEKARFYGDSSWTELRAAISEVHQLNPEMILVGAGSMELISRLIPAYVGPGDRVLSTAYSYAFFRTATQAAGGTYDAVDEPDRTVSVDLILDSVDDRTKLVCIVNPGNPTGTRISRAEILRLRTGLPEDVILVIDEAYAEFADLLGEQLFDMAASGNTIILRTFSKAYGMAGIRVGWGYFPPSIAGEVRKLLNVGNVPEISLAAATAAMQDQQYMAGVRDRTSALRDRFRDQVRTIGLDVDDSYTNFVLIRFRDKEEAASADAALRAEGIKMRPMAMYSLPHCLRATISVAEDMDFTHRVLSDWAARERPEGAGGT